MRVSKQAIVGVCVSACVNVRANICVCVRALCLIDAFAPARVSTDLVRSAVADAHGVEGRQLGLHALLVVLQLLPLDLLPHFPGLLNGLHHSVLVPKQCCGVQTGQNVWGGGKEGLLLRLTQQPTNQSRV